MSVLALGSILLLMLSSCKKDETRVTASLGNTGTLAATTTSPALSLATGANTAVTFSWPATPVTGYAGAVTYSLQFDKQGNNFKAPREVAASGLSTPVTVVALNTVLLNLGLPTDVTAQVNVRLKSVIAPNVMPTYSNALTLSVKPYSLISYLYVAGGYQGWNPGAAPNIQSAISNGIYEGTVTVPAGTTDFGFKLTSNKDWNGTNYGSSGAGKLSADGGAGNITFPSAGTYKIVANLNDLTYTITKQ